MNIELKPIAESKVRQLGGDVCGVLVRKDGKLAAVDEHGRVTWLRNRQGADLCRCIGPGNGCCCDRCDPGLEQAARAQSGQGAELVGYLHNRPERIPCFFESYDEAMLNGCEVVPVYTRPQPEGDGWVKCSERLPKLGQRVQLFSQGVIQHMMPLFDDSDEGPFWDFEVHDYNPPVDMSRDQWRPLPQPPQEGE